jgi:hypothetical protein
MRFTILILLLPFLMFLGLLLAVDHSDAAIPPLWILWLISVVVCLAWGFYISRRRRFLGWLCVGVALLHFILLLLPLLGRHQIRKGVASEVRLMSPNNSLQATAAAPASCD